MSTNCIAIQQDGSFAEIPFAALFDGRMEKYGVQESICDDRSATRRCLTDGNNFLWAFQDTEKPGRLSSLTRYFPNGAPGKILAAVEEEFDVRIVSEYEPEYWGFATQEEWDAVQDEIARETSDRNYLSLAAYVRGEDNDITPGTIGMIWAEAAKKFVAEDPSLLNPERKEEFLRLATASYQGIMVRLDEKDLAAAKMLATHEDDLPRA